MIYELDPDDPSFPYADEAEETGLLAIGGDLSVDRLLNAYASGVFPWYAQGEPVLWWSLNPRMVLFPNEFRCSKSLWRTARSGRYEVRVDTCFEEVIRACATVQRRDEEGTWISEDMIQAYTELHEKGFAHSFEAFEQGRLTGGLYGVSMGDLFFGESMFHTAKDASKV
ncbi:MAG: leucyl/phenylalanyl-tRNA--protein transferase, partial [Bacteroidales bacterium]|nr:leucyl/phenylalanyl-tRNA--protein transferase [Bacteroidales bacterium]